jgi:hypothetical protein
MKVMQLSGKEYRQKRKVSDKRKEIMGRQKTVEMTASDNPQKQQTSAMMMMTIVYSRISINLINFYLAFQHQNYSN